MFKRNDISRVSLHHFRVSSPCVLRSSVSRTKSKKKPPPRPFAKRRSVEQTVRDLRTKISVIGPRIPRLRKSDRAVKGVLWVGGGVVARWIVVQRVAYCRMPIALRYRTQSDMAGAPRIGKPSAPPTQPRQPPPPVRECVPQRLRQHLRSASSDNPNTKTSRSRDQMGNPRDGVLSVLRLKKRGFS